MRDVRAVERLRLSVDETGRRHALGQLGKRKLFRGSVDIRAVGIRVRVRLVSLEVGVEVVEVEFHDACSAMQ